MIGICTAHTVQSRPCFHIYRTLHLLSYYYCRHFCRYTNTVFVSIARTRPNFLVHRTTVFCVKSATETNFLGLKPSKPFGFVVQQLWNLTTTNNMYRSATAISVRCALLHSTFYLLLSWLMASGKLTIKIDSTRVVHSIFTSFKAYETWQDSECISWCFSGRGNMRVAFTFRNRARYASGIGSYQELVIYKTE